MFLLKVRSEEEGDGEVDNSPYVRRAIGLCANVQHDAVLCTVEVDVLNELAVEDVGRCSQWVVCDIVVLDEIGCLNVGGFFLHT